MTKKNPSPQDKLGKNRFLPCVKLRRGAVLGRWFYYLAIILFLGVIGETLCPAASISLEVKLWSASLFIASNFFKKTVHSLKIHNAKLQNGGDISANIGFLFFSNFSNVKMEIRARIHFFNGGESLGFHAAKG